MGWRWGGVSVLFPVRVRFARNLSGKKELAGTVRGKQQEGSWAAAAAEEHTEPQPNSHQAAPIGKTQHFIFRVVSLSASQGRLSPTAAPRRAHLLGQPLKSAAEKPLTRSRSTLSIRASAGDAALKKRRNEFATKKKAGGAMGSSVSGAGRAHEQEVEI